MDGEVVDPNDQHRHVDGQHPEHEDEHRGGVVVEIVVGTRVSVPGESQCPYASAQLHDCEDHVGELVWYEGGDEQEQYGCRDEALSSTSRGETCCPSVAFISNCIEVRNDVRSCAHIPAIALPTKKASCPAIDERKYMH